MTTTQLYHYLTARQINTSVSEIEEIIDLLSLHPDEVDLELFQRCIRISRDTDEVALMYALNSDEFEVMQPDFEGGMCIDGFDDEWKTLNKYKGEIESGFDFINAVFDYNELLNLSEETS